MIAGSFFFAVAGREIFYCRAVSQTAAGLRAHCLNHNFDALVSDDGYLDIPHAGGGRRARVELVTFNLPPKFNPRDHGEAISYFLKRRAVKSEGIAS